MANPTFSQLTQRLAPNSQWLTLFILDATAIGGPLERWTPGPLGNASVSLGGNVFNSVPIEAVDFEYNGQGPLPTPKLRVANLNNVAMGMLIANNDLLGAQVTRLRTFACYLDGGQFADASAVTDPDIYRVDRKSHADKNFVELELAAVTDQQGKQLPFRQVLQNVCGRTYRVWNGTSFVQQNCPYTGSNYLDALDNVQTDPSKDQCSRSLKGCAGRFGQTALLPTWAFPGVSINGGG